MALWDNLEGYWQFEAVDFTGDSSHKNLDLTNNGSIASGTGIIGNGAVFNNTNTKFFSRSADDAVFDFGSADFTIQLWAKWTGTSNEQTLIEKLVGPSGPGWTFFKSSGHKISFATTGAGTPITGATTITTGVWYHIVVRRNGSDWELFLNNSSDDTGSTASAIDGTTAVLRIGEREGGQSFPLDATIDEIAIWSRALTNDEISSLYNSGAGLNLAALPDMSGTATLSAAAAITYQPAANLEATAVIFGDLVNLNSSGNLEGTATLSGVLALTFLPLANLEGTATLSAGITSNFAATASLEATAVINGPMRFTYRPTVSAEATAVLKSYAEHFRPMTSNPPLAGDLIPITNQARFLFTVNTTAVSLSHPYFNMEELYFDYDKKTLSFSEIATPTIGRPTWNPEANVKLEIDFNDGDGLITYFSGQITRRNHYGVNNEESIKYQAEGIQTLANRVTLLNTTAKPEVIFTVGTTVLTIVGSTEVTTTFSKTIRNAVIDLFTVMSSSLMANSISAAVDTPTLNTINGDLPQTVQITNQGFFSGLSQVMGFEPGKRAYWDDTIQKWTFPDIPNAVTILTQIESSQLENCIYDVSTEGRYTAIRLVADQEDGLDDNLITKSQTLTTNKGTFNIQRVDVSLTKKWDPTIEGLWSYWDISEETTFINSGGVPLFDTPYQWVYRRWSMPENTIEKWPGTPVNFYAKIKEVQGDTAAERWVKFNGSADFKRKQVIARDFIISKNSDPYVKPLAGQRLVYGPDEVKMTYYPRGYLYGTFVSSVSTAGTPTYVTTNFDSALLFDELRYPNTGYEGTAYSMFGIQREFVEIVDITEVTTANALSRLAPLKDVVISGELPFIGDPVKSFMNLRAKVRVAHATKLTGIQSVDAYMMGYRYQFGRPGGNYVQLSTDKAALVRV